MPGFESRILIVNRVYLGASVEFKIFQQRYSKTVSKNGTLLIFEYNSVKN